MREILSDLVAEEQALDQLLQRINPRDWHKKKIRNGWTIHELVSYLSESERYAYNALAEGGTALADFDTLGGIDGIRKKAIRVGDGMRSQDIIEVWRGARAKVIEELFRAKPTDRIPTFIGTMSARTFATAKLVEAWSFALEVDETIVSEEEIEDTLRLRHIAWFAWACLPYAFSKAGVEYDGSVRVEVMGPKYSKWVFGPTDSDQLIRGQAADWCRVAVGFIQPEDAPTIKTEGDMAATALELVNVEL
ncbi:MAG: maleylpyruvate isomerase family mycothiol-dependent enzyme [Acidimicrobiia bacterium]|nr:maleylpyruvate isomerase family mycothiol-dependent enzyme [Acidimicrobiia bacterium]MDH5421441.1 maleylpyruvate isomerase family mycothiol-dependent enzyme [Acidimicrobiia bacterium]MDH5502507.1 maleylpyruvate isomerase family mycothiol-dependent enzyme [Acidimicrobiia bacterium]